jgi:Lrp/AsnC family transcriptional regulator, leucine-responsive regulatory protein
VRAKMDHIDVKLLSAMEKDSRVSLKYLAKELDIKTSTIYHRLHKLKESNILESFTIVVNPEEIGLQLHCQLILRLKKLPIGKLDSMFLESFAKYLAEEYNEILFASVGSDEQIHLIASFRDQAHFDMFSESLNENGYIDKIQTTVFSKILKGKKIFSFIANQHALEEGEKFDDGTDEFEEVDESEVITVEF